MKREEAPMAGLNWEDKYDADGTRTVPLRLQLPLETVEYGTSRQHERAAGVCTATVAYVSI